MSSNSKLIRLSLLVSLLIMALPLATLAQTNPVTNLDTGKTFETIQAAIDDPDTADGHTIEVDSSTYDSANEPGGNPWGNGEALIYVDKSVTMRSTGGAEATVIDGRGHRATVGINASGVKLIGFKVIGADLSSTDPTASGVAVSGEVSGVVIENNIVTGNEYRGISLWKSQDCKVINNTISNNIRPASENHSGFGLEVHRSDNNLIQDNEVANNDDEGITVLGSYSNTIKSNKTSRNASEGIEIWSEIDWDAGEVVRVSKENEIVGNEVVDNEGRGIGIFGASDNLVDNNLVNENSGHGIELEPAIDRENDKLVRASTKNEITNNDVLDNQATGIVIEGSSDNLISSNHVAGNVHFGIRVSLSHDPEEDSFVSQATGNEIMNNTVKDTIKPEDSWAGVGVIVDGAKKNIVDGNEVAGNNDGIMVLDKAEDNLVKNNAVTQNGDGVTVRDSSNNNLIEENEITDNDEDGIVLNGASFNVIRGNTVSTNGERGITMGAKVDWETHELISPSKGNEILNNEILDNKYFGIGIDGSSNNLISKNEISNNGDFGVSITPRWAEFRAEIIQPAEGNEIINNTLKNTSPSSWDISAGVRIDEADDNNINNNNISNNYLGIANWRADGNSIRDNLLEENKWDGIHLWGNSDNNSVISNEISGTYGETEEGDVWGIGIGCFGLDTEADDPLNNNNEFRNNYVHDNAFGVAINESKGALIKNNSVEDNNTGERGFYSRLVQTENTTWDLVTEFTGGGGIHVVGTENEVVDNQVTGNGFGIEIQGGNDPVQAEGNLVRNNTVKNNSTGEVTLKLERYEQTSTSSGTKQERADELNHSPNIVPQTTQPQSWEVTKTLEVAKPGSFGLLLANASGTLVEDNLFGNNGDNGLAMRGFSFPEYDLSGQSSQNQFVSNVVDGNSLGIIIGPYGTDNDFEKNQVSDNTLGIFNRENATGNAFSQNSIFENEQYGAQNLAAEPLAATENYWGAPSGPYHQEKNPDGKGDEVSDGVEFDPWLEVSPFETTTTFGPGWHLFSPPGIPRRPDPAKALGKDIDDLNLYYDYSNGSYKYYPKTSTQLAWTQAYWTYLTEGKKVGMATRKVPGDEKLWFEEEGWQMIGVPYKADWSKARFSDPNDFQTDGAGNVRLVSWDPNNERYLNHYSDDSHVLNDWFGYWVKVKEASPSDMAHVSFTRTDQNAAAVDAKTPLPESVDASELDYPPLPRQLTDNFQALAYPNPLTQKDQVTFTARMPEVEKIKVTVTNTVGQTIHETGYQTGDKLTWDLTSTSGNKVVNGIYLYQVQATRDDGTQLSSDVKQLLVLK